MAHEVKGIFSEHGDLRVGAAAAIGVVLATVAVNRLLHGRIVGFNPWIAMIGTWAGVIALYLINPLGLVPLHSGTWWLVGGALALFTIGYALVMVVYRALGELPPPGSISSLDEGSLEWRHVRFLWRLCTAWFVIFFAMFMRFAVNNFGFNPIAIIGPLRAYLSINNAPIGFYYFYAAQIMVPLGILIWRHGRPRRTRYLLGSVGAFASLWLTSGRTNIINVLIWTAAALAFELGARGMRFRTVVRAVELVLVGLALFVFMGNAIGKSYSNSPLKDTGFLPRELALPYLYAVGSLPALDQMRTGGSMLTPNASGSRLAVVPRHTSLRAFYQVAAVFDRDVEIPPSSFPFWLIPYPFNTVTYIGPILVDFGALGVLLFSFVLGLIAAWTYIGWLRSPRIGSLLLASLCVLMEILSPFALRANELSLWVAGAAAIALLWAERTAHRRARRQRAFLPTPSAPFRTRL